MEDREEKIVNLQLLVDENCTEKEKEIINFYWALEDFEFINTLKQLKERFEISQVEMSKIISRQSELSFYMYCESCNSYENQLATSRTKYLEIIKLKSQKAYNHSYTCSDCTAIENEKKYQEKEEAQKKFLQKFEKAIDDKNWNNLSNYEREILIGSLQMDFTKLKKKYGGGFGNQSFINLIRTLEKIADQNLILLLRNERNNYISRYQYLPRLTEFIDEIKVPKKTNENYAMTKKESNELRFKLTINEHQYHPDSPLYAGTVTFNERIVIEPGVEYIFGLWQRAKDNLYLTMTPIENLEKLPSQKRISNQPITLQKGITDFLSNLGRDLDF
jgi:hypothetical protein